MGWDEDKSDLDISPCVDAHLREHRTDSEELVHGAFLRAFRDTVLLPNGRSATREYVVHPGAVMVVPLLRVGGESRVVLERQFRYPVGRVMVEFPAGKLDADEQSLQCAVRELREETGYRATRWAKAGTIHPVIAYSTEFIDVWFAEGLVLGQRQLDDGEFLDVFDVPIAQFLQMCLDGSVTDAKTLVGAFWLQNYLMNGFALHWRDASLENTNHESIGSTVQPWTSV